MLIGVLALQGGVEEHAKILLKLGEKVRLVKEEKDLDGLDGIILPGGESTAIRKLLNAYGLFNALKNKIKEGLCTYGTCSGMILLARNIENEEKALGLMDITVKRNAYGRQSSSFKIDMVIPKVSEKPIPLVFIRAPYIEKVGPDVEVLLKVDNKIVMARQKNMLVSSFHPELTNNTLVHEYFLRMIKAAK